jgi:hypothetical protein
MTIPDLESDSDMAYPPALQRGQAACIGIAKDA